MARRPALLKINNSVEILIKCLGEKSFGILSNSESIIIVENRSEWIGVISIRKRETTQTKVKAPK